MSTRNEPLTIRRVFARAFNGEGGVIEPSQKAIVIAVLLGMAVGAVFTRPAAENINDAVAASTTPTVLETEFAPID